MNKQLTHEFTQIKNKANILAAFNGTSGPVGEVTLNCTSFRVVEAYSTMFGFGVTDTTMNGLRSLFSTPQVIPTQELGILKLNGQPNSNGIEHLNISLNLDNVSAVGVMFPRRSNDRTVYHNIMYRNFHVSIDGRNYPDQPVTTLDARFYQCQLVNGELYGCCEVTNEYENSLTQSKNASDPNSIGDSTSFMVNVALE